jgi:hypothetical protein
VFNGLIEMLVINMDDETDGLGIGIQGTNVQFVYTHSQEMLHISCSRRGPTDGSAVKCSGWVLLFHKSRTSDS